MIKDYAKISPTALMVAYFRAKYTNMPYSQIIYEKTRKFKNKSLLELISPVLGYLAKFYPGSLERLSSLEGRYLAINEALKKLDSKISIIEIAAGLSARSLEWSGQELIYLETDLPEIIGIKEKIFSEISVSQDLETNQNHHFLSLNAINEKEWEKIGKKYFEKKSERVAIIHEGLISYLTDEEKEKLRNNIRNFLSIYSPNGVWITTDFSTYKRKETAPVSFAKKLIQKNTQRKFNYFENQQKVINFLNTGGLEVRILNNSDIFNKLTCVKKSGMSRAKVEEVMPNYQAYCITLKK
jgi:O-methyltransferase involved in polyketide biosynthesis